ncbi:transposase [Nocardia altamirensis]|uniref:transposase n=1 Tax=Nocardia altamirensis TaxID=472158 RepID=UPI000840630F|nr:transposase [Nocardia altamirensis]
MGAARTAAAATGATAAHGGRPEKWRRLVRDAIFYPCRGGIALAQLPHDFTTVKTVYDIYRRWTKAVAWQRIHYALRDRARVRAERDARPSAAAIDSQTLRGADTISATH